MYVVDRVVKNRRAYINRSPCHSLMLYLEKQLEDMCLIASARTSITKIEYNEPSDDIIRHVLSMTYRVIINLHLEKWLCFRHFQRMTMPIVPK